MSLLWALPVGLSVGILSGFFGVGGGFILTPVLLLLGFHPTSAVATSLLYSTSTSLSGSFAHIKLGNVVWKTAIILAGSGVIATQAAYPLVVWAENLGSYDRTISILYVILLGYFALSIWRNRNNRNEVVNASPALWKMISIGLLGGFISTVLGVGGGFIMVPLLMTVLGYESRKAVGISLFSVLFIVLSGSITYMISTPINFKLAALLIIGALLGSQIGAKLTSLYPSPKIQIYLGGLYVVTFLSMFLKLTFGLVYWGLGIIGVYAAVLFILFTLQFRRHKLGIPLAKSKTA